MGNYLMTSFECDRCVFVKLKGRIPAIDAPKDKLLIGAIRYVNLDAFWSRESSMAQWNLASVRKITHTSASADLSGSFKPYGPMPLFNHCEYKIAVDMVLASRFAGRHSKGYSQFNTIRKL